MAGRTLSPFRDFWLSQQQDRCLGSFYFNTSGNTLNIVTKESERIHCDESLNWLAFE